MRLNLYILLIKTINSYESFKVIPTISEHFRRFSEDFPKILEVCKNALKTVLNNFRSFPRISEHFRSFPKFFLRLHVSQYINDHKQKLNNEELRF